MKSIYTYLLIIATVLFAACSDEDNLNTNDVKVSFGQSEYTFLESAGMVTVPLKVEGERNGDIKVQLKVTDGTAISEGHYIVTSDVINIPANSEDATFDVEIIILDDGATENDDRNFNIAIANVEGASTGTNATCNIILQDVDKNPYFKLFGDWTLTAVDAGTGEELSWDVNISDNDGDDSYAEDYLVFKGYNEAGTYTADAIWLVAYDKSGTLSITATDYFYATYNFGSFIGAVAITPMDMSGKPTTQAIPGTFNDTFDEIVFDTSSTLLGLKVHEYDTNTGAIGEYMGRLGNPYANVRLVKK